MSTSVPTIEPLGDRALLLRWGRVADPAVNRLVHALAATIRAAAPPWLVDCVPAYASLAVHFDDAVIPGDPPAASVRTWLVALLDQAASTAPPTTARLVEIPVCYGGDCGPDLDAVAAACGISAADYVARHAGAEYRVAMLGFSPGFPYLLGLDPALAVPRLATPRLCVPAGSVGIGGAQTGIYPDAGPGGWRLVGRTPQEMFDPSRDPPAHVLPGDRVRFVAISAERFQAWPRGPAVIDGGPAGEPASAVEVLAGGLQTTVQDLGRFGHRHLGVGVAGALDGHSLRIGNLLVGNAENTAGLEIALQGPRLRFREAVRIAITGATIDARAGGVEIPGWRPVDLPAGSELVFGGCRRGARAYLAVAGGVRVAPVLGSAGTDLRAGFGGFGGRSLAAGDVLALGDAFSRDDVPSASAAARSAALPPSCGSDEKAMPRIAPWWIDPRPDLDFAAPPSIRVLAGHDAVAPGSALFSSPWRVTAQSNRQGLRLQGASLAPAEAGDRLSEPVAPGTLQLPPDGQPIVLLAEAQTIGGYPRIGHVIAADLPRLAQLRPGDSVRFEPVDAAAAQALACAQRHRLTRIALAISRRRSER